MTTAIATSDLAALEQAADAAQKAVEQAETVQQIANNRLSAARMQIAGTEMADLFRTINDVLGQQYPEVAYIRRVKDDTIRAVGVGTAAGNQYEISLRYAGTYTPQQDEGQGD